MVPNNNIILLIILFLVFNSIAILSFFKSIIKIQASNKISWDLMIKKNNFLPFLIV